MTCQDFEELVLDQLGNRNAGEHVATCGQCAEFLRAQQELDALLTAGLAQLAPSPHLEPVFWRRWRRERVVETLDRLFPMLDTLAAVATYGAAVFFLSALR